MNNSIKFLVEEIDNNERIDIYLSKKIENLTRSFVKKLIIQGHARLNDKIIISPSNKIKTGDRVIVEIIEKNNNNIIQKIDLNIIFEDKDIIVINKPKGMVVHPGSGNFKNTLVNALLF